MEIESIRKNLSNEYYLECERELARNDVKKALSDQDKNKTAFLRKIQPILIGLISLYFLYILYEAFQKFLY